MEPQTKLTAARKLQVQGAAARHTTFDLKAETLFVVTFTETGSAVH